MSIFQINVDSEKFCYTSPVKQITLHSPSITRVFSYKRFKKLVYDTTNPPNEKADKEFGLKIFHGAEVIELFDKQYIPIPHEVMEWLAIEISSFLGLD